MRNIDKRLDYIEDLLYKKRHFLKSVIDRDIGHYKYDDKSDIIVELRKIFPNSTSEEIYSMLYLLLRAYNRNSTEKLQLIWSGPDVSGLPGRDTEIVLEDIIKSAQHSIIVSIYSLSDYAENILNLIKRKANHGLYVEIFIDNFEAKSEMLQDLLEVDSSRLYIYEYVGAENYTQSLHAKVLTIDDSQSIVTSSNLSYNGMDGNLELGVLLSSKEKSKEIRAIFSSLIKKRYFKRVNNRR